MDGPSAVAPTRSVIEPDAHDGVYHAFDLNRDAAMAQAQPPPPRNEGCRNQEIKAFCLKINKYTFCPLKSLKSIEYHMFSFAINENHWFSLEINENEIWFGTSSGICRFNWLNHLK